MEQQYVTDSGQRLKLRLKPNNRLGVGGQGQVFRATLAGVPVAVKLLCEVDISRIEALRQLPVACASHATLPQHLLYHCRRGSKAEPAGYVMPCIDPEKSLSAARLFNFEELKLLKRFTWRDGVLAALLLAARLQAEPLNSKTTHVTGMLLRRIPVLLLESDPMQEQQRRCTCPSAR